MIKNIPFAEVTEYNIIPDTFDDVKKALNEGLILDSDIVIASGGSSMGDYDYVLEVLDSIGAKVFFNKVKVKPGKPTIFAKINDTIIFGLPGNPVSVYINFEVFVKEAIYALQGIKNTPIYISPILNFDYKRKRAERKEFVPIQLVREGNDLLVEKIQYNGSGNIAAYNGVSFVMEIEPGTTLIAKGERVAARQIWKNY